MSLEDRIEKLTGVMERHNTLLEELIAKGAVPTQEKSPGKGDSDKAKTAGAGKAAGKGPGRPRKEKEPTDDDVREKFGSFFALETDRVERRRLVAAIQPILNHFGVERVSETPAENRAEALKYGDMLIEAYNEGGVEAVEDVRFPFMAEDGGDDGDDGGGDNVL